MAHETLGPDHDPNAPLNRPKLTDDPEPGGMGDVPVKGLEGTAATENIGVPGDPSRPKRVPRPRREFHEEWEGVEGGEGRGAVGGGEGCGRATGSPAPRGKVYAV